MAYNTLLYYGNTIFSASDISANTNPIHLLFMLVDIVFHAGSIGHGPSVSKCFLAAHFWPQTWYAFYTTKLHPAFPLYFSSSYTSRVHLSREYEKGLHINYQFLLIMEPLNTPRSLFFDP